MSTMTPQDRAETTKAAFDALDLTEWYRIKAGVRDTPHWVQKTTRCSGRHANVPCRGCYEAIERGASIIWEEDVNCHVAARRHRFWHLECHPDWINREFERLRDHVATHGWPV